MVFFKRGISGGDTMKLRLAGKIVCGSLSIVFVILALIYVRLSDEHIQRAIVLAILSLTSAVSYRYFEY